MLNPNEGVLQVLSHTIGVVPPQQIHPSMHIDLALCAREQKRAFPIPKLLTQSWKRTIV